LSSEFWQRQFIYLIYNGKVPECNIENKVMFDQNWYEYRECWNSVVLGGEDAELFLDELEVKN